MCSPTPSCCPRRPCPHRPARSAAAHAARVAAASPPPLASPRPAAAASSICPRAPGRPPTARPHVVCIANPGAGGLRIVDALQYILPNDREALLLRIENAGLPSISLRVDWFTRLSRRTGSSCSWIRGSAGRATRPRRSRGHLRAGCGSQRERRASTVRRHRKTQTGHGHVVVGEGWERELEGQRGGFRDPEVR